MPLWAPSASRAELEHRARVVVEPAHEPRVDVVVDPRAVEQPADLLEVLAVLVREPVEHLRRGIGDARIGRVPVERPHRVQLDPAALLGVEDVARASRKSRSSRAYSRARLRRRRCSSGGAARRQAEPRIEVPEQVDQLGVERRVVGADRLRADLAVLAVAARPAGAS